ncbi:MAG: tetratricopeptide repeat protein, partial [FCB group bacterium]|nr:tetratricopeptide repeat protein [FCB group bacterium]
QEEQKEDPAPVDKGSADLLSNADIESLLAEIESGTQDAQPADAPDPNAAGGTAELLNNDDLDSLLASLNSSPPVDPEASDSGEPAQVPAESAAEPPRADGALDGGTLEGETPPAEDPKPASAVEGAAPATATAKEEPAAQGEILSQDLIESLVRGARHRQGEPDVAPPAEPPAAPPPQKQVAVEEPLPAPSVEAPPRKRGWLTTRLAASLALGFFSGACVFLYLASHPYRAFDAKTMNELRVTVPGQALGVASGLAKGDRFSEARNELKPALENLPPGEARTDAEFLDIEAAYNLLPDNAKVPVLKDMIRTIDRLLGEAPAHPKALDARLWKADLLQRAEMSEAAYEAYSQVLTQSDNPPGLDKGLLGAAKSALHIERPNDAINHLRRLLQAFPNSPLRGEAEYWLGNAYLDAGDMEAGRMTLMSVARSNRDSELGADAYARLGGLSYDAGDYDEAIRLFEARLQTATKVAGNDKIYLLLARAHRVKSELAQAERVLRELIDFFPESAQIPAALVELSQVLEGLGRRDEAVQIAKQAAQQYANDPAVLENAGYFLVDTGEAAAGADTLVAAERAGAENPAVLLEAARQYRAAKDLDKAAEIYQRLLDDYSNATEAFQAGIELARVDFEKGHVRDALARMEQNAIDAKGRPAYAQALDALASLYDEVGLRNRATEAFREMAGETSDSVMLARAALTLFDAGQAEDGLTLMGRIDKGALPEALAYGLLMRQGRVLAETNPEQALALMEQAYTGYPDDRRPEDVQRLLEAYLALDRTAAARALVLDAETRARSNPSEIPTLEAAAARWGDHLFQRGDYTAAAEGYALASNAAGGDPKASRSETSVWSRYQQANCLFRQENLIACLPLFEEVAGGTSPWSDLARAKADYVGLEMRRRGIVPPAPVPAATEPPAPAEPSQQTPVAPPQPEPAQPAAAEATPPASEG